MEQSVWSKSMSLKEQKGILSRIFKFALPFKKGFIISVIFGIGLSLADAFAPRIIQIFIDDYVAKGNATFAVGIQFALFYLLIVVMRMITMYFQNFLFSMASEKNGREHS